MASPAHFLNGHRVGCSLAVPRAETQRFILPQDWYIADRLIIGGTKMPFALDLTLNIPISQWGSSSRRRNAIRHPTNKIGNVLVHAATKAGMSRTTSMDLPELIS